MKLNEEEWNRWIDGALSPEDAKAMALEENVELSQDQAFFSRLSADLKQTFPAERTPPFADFFNSHLQKQIRDLREAEQNRSRSRPEWLPDWFRLSWFVPLAGATALVLTLMQIGLLGEPSGSRITYAYTPDESVTALTDFNEDVNAMVLRLQGMAPLPEAFDLVLADAKTPAHAEPEVATSESHGEQERDDEAFAFVGPQIHFTSHGLAY